MSGRIQQGIQTVTNKSIAFQMSGEAILRKAEGGIELT